MRQVQKNASSSYTCRSDKRPSESLVFLDTLQPRVRLQTCGSPRTKLRKCFEGDSIKHGRFSSSETEPIRKEGRGKSGKVNGKFIHIHSSPEHCAGNVIPLALHLRRWSLTWVDLSRQVCINEVTWSTWSTCRPAFSIFHFNSNPKKKKKKYLRKIPFRF